MMSKLAEYNTVINDFVWGKGLYLLLFTGLLATLITGVFQIKHIKHWFSQTLGSLFKKEVSGHVQGKSMYPTLNDGQTVIVEKTKNVKVGNMVVANSSEYGVIIKRVSQIKGDEIYLTSDNTNVESEYRNGVLYETKGITTWVDSDDIYGVVVQY